MIFSVIILIIMFILYYSICRLPYYWKLFVCFIFGHPVCIVQNIDNKIYWLGFHLHFHLRSGVKEYAILWWIDEQRRKKKMSGRHSQISTMRMLMSSREPVNSWKLAGKKKMKKVK